MQPSTQAQFKNSIADTLGALYERKARGTTLIRVLEDYRRVQAVPKAPSPGSQLEWLRLRRAAVDQVIRSIEAYSETTTSS
jgi:hypothetical protein